MFPPGPAGARTPPRRKVCHDPTRRPIPPPRPTGPPAMTAARPEGKVATRLAQAISRGALAEPVRLRTHGGRARAIDRGEMPIDAAFVAAPAADALGNLTGRAGRAPCITLGYPMLDAGRAAREVAVTDTLVPFPAMPIDIPRRRSTRSRWWTASAIRAASPRARCGRPTIRSARTPAPATSPLRSARRPGLTSRARCRMRWMRRRGGPGWPTTTRCGPRSWWTRSASGAIRATTPPPC